MRAQKSFVRRVLFRRHCIGIDDAMAHISGCFKKGVCAPARMGAAAATAGNAAGVGGSGAGDMQRGGGGGEKSRYQEDGPQHRRAEEGSEALTGGSKAAEPRGVVEVVPPCVGAALPKETRMIVTMAPRGPWEGNTPLTPNDGGDIQCVASQAML